MEPRYRTPGSALIGMLLIMLGAVFLLATEGWLGLSWGTIWPAFLLILGILALGQALAAPVAQRAGLSALGAFLALLSIFFFVTTRGAVAWADQATLWPLYVIFLGAAGVVGAGAAGFRRPGYLGSGIALLALGGLLLAGSLGGWLGADTWATLRRWSGWSLDWPWVATWWPVALIAAGLLVLLPVTRVHSLNARGGLTFLGTLPLLLGAFFLATTLGPLTWSDQGQLWPLYPVIVGAAFLAASLASGGSYSYTLPGLVSVVVGGAFLLPLLPGLDRLGEGWPLLFILAGVLLLFLPRLRRMTR